MTKPPVTLGSDVRRYRTGDLNPAIPIAIALVAAIYLLQLFSPLRLNTDAVTLLSMARNAQRGLGFTEHGHRTQFPVGYPLIVVGLDQVHCACSASFIAVNLVCLTVAVWQFRKIAEAYWPASRQVTRLVILLYLLSFPLVKHVTIPLTELPFSALMMSSLRYLLDWSKGTARSAMPLIVAIVLILMSIFVRTLGIALLPALVWGIITATPVKAWLGAKERRPLLAAALAVGIAFSLAAVWLVTKTTYFQYFASASQHPIRLVRTAVTGRLTDATELFCNIPIDKIGRVPGGLLIGVVPVMLVLLGLIYRRKFGALEVFLLGYIAILTVWPFGDPRFWIPVIPFLILLASNGFDAMPFGRIAPILKYGYLTVFASLGLAALAYSSKLTLSGDRFADLYGSPNTRANYQIAFGRPVDPGTQPDPAWQDLLARYESRARAAQHAEAKR